MAGNALAGKSRQISSYRMMTKQTSKHTNCTNKTRKHTHSTDGKKNKAKGKQLMIVFGLEHWQSTHW
jgi:hypothetical protein